ncbi:MAG: hypothetical protein JST28_04645 [Acidobacteria bacterium]|nr:hypothetical protein [Acidobacteriota bacterium]
MKLFRKEDGQTLVFTALLMCCLMGFMALSIDVGVLFRAQRKIQTAADAGAIAGTIEYYYHGSGNVISVAKAAAASNVCPASDSACITTAKNQVTVNLPPVNGWHTGPSYVEVIMNRPNPTIFMGTFSGLFPGGGASGISPMNVAARAVGGIVAGASCVYLLNQTDPGALTIKGNADVTSPNCSWTVDSSSPQAFCITGQNSGAQFNVPAVILPGGQSTSGNCNKLYGGVTTGGSQFQDPLGNSFSFPDPTNTNICNPAAGGNVVTAATVTNSTTLNPKSVNVGGFNTASTNYNVVCFKAAGGIPTTLSGVTLGSNSDTSKNTLYLFEQGLVLSGTNTIYGTVDLSGGAFCQGTYNTSNGKCNFTSAGGGPSITINSPASVAGGTQYAYNGMAFIVNPANNVASCDSSYHGINVTSNGDPNSCIQIQFGSNSGQLDGMIYAPYSALYIQDSGGTGIGVTNLIVNSTFINGELNITANYNYQHADSPLNFPELVE